MTGCCSLSPPRGGGPGGGPAAIQLGFAAEPIIDLADADATTLYSECLALLRVANSAMFSSSDFVGGLEARGDIGLLDAAIVDLVLDALASSPYRSLGCNVSPKTLADAGAWRALFDRIAQRAWLAGRLTLEITETYPINEIPGAAQRLMEAKRLGCRLAIDDFGAGLDTSVHLQGVDVDWDIVKLDRRCLGDLRKTPSGRYGLRSFVALATCLAPVVVVEGIETHDHLLAALAAGAQYGQGWLFVGAVHDRWTVPDVMIRDALVALLAERPGQNSGLLQPPTCPEAISEDERMLSARTDRIGNRVRTLVARAWAGGAR